MEVHHSHTARKKWTHYFWEFLMLFLAVTLGFFVENQREHLIEHKRAKQYALFLHNDLVKDSANLTERINFMSTGIKTMDTMILILKSLDPGKSEKSIYTLSSYSYSNPIFIPNISTIEQLKSSGSLRYFRSQKLIRNFSDYDNNIRLINTIEDRNAYITEETRKFLSQFLDLKGVPLPRVVASDSIGEEQTLIPEILNLYKKERVQFEHYANLCTLKQIDWLNRIRVMRQTLTSARNLILSLKEEYHLK